MRRLILTALGISVLAGCEAVESEDVNTSGLYADLWVIAEGDGASRAVGILRVGGELSNTFVDLTGGDELTATREGEDPIVMVEQQLLDARSYRADFTDDTPDLDITIAFEREIDESAPDSVMSLPQPFTLGPVEDQYSRLTDDIVLTWDNTQSEEVAVWVEGPCIVNHYTTRKPDTGSWTISAEDIQANEGAEEENCELEITVWRSRAGSVDPAYGKGGKAWGHQTRMTTTLSIP